MTRAEGVITTPAGFRAAGICCGIKEDKKDLALIVCDTRAVAAAVFTSNRFCAAPVRLSRERVRSGHARAIIANSGCANACTGRQGMDDAVHVASRVAEALGVSEGEVLVASTGRIGVRLPVGKIEDGLGELCAALSVAGGADAAEAILTTDSFPKEVVEQFELGGSIVTVAGMAKGAGMIHPAMATMLAFITTDAAVSPACLQRMLEGAVEKTFNAITVDGDRSTNDSVFVLASGMAGNPYINDVDSPSGQLLQQAVDTVTYRLAEMIVRDGEGATKMMEITVRGARDHSSAKRCACAIGNSVLLKCAIYGGDPNWGRVLSALGAAGVEIIPEKVSLSIQGVCVFREGEPQQYDASGLKDQMKTEDISIEVELGEGEAGAKILSSDLTPEYVTFNSA